MARKKETPWQRRNREAQEKGYRNYYDYRKHGYGERPPGEPVQPGTARRYTGGGKRGLQQALRQHSSGKAPIALIGEIPYRTNKAGQVTRVNYVTTYADGRIREFIVAVDDEYDMDWWHEEFEDADVEYLPYGQASE